MQDLHTAGQDTWLRSGQSVVAVLICQTGVSLQASEALVFRDMMHSLTFNSMGASYQAQGAAHKALCTSWVELLLAPPPS